MKIPKFNLIVIAHYQPHMDLSYSADLHSATKPNDFIKQLHSIITDLQWSASSWHANKYTFIIPHTEYITRIGEIKLLQIKYESIIVEFKAALKNNNINSDCVEYFNKQLTKCNFKVETFNE